MVSLSVITPTIGRHSLLATARSLVSQLRAGDEWILVGDGEQERARAVAEKARSLTPAHVRYAEVKDATSQFGNAQRDFALSIARGSHLCFLDDDDVWNPGAGAMIRAAAVAEPEKVHVFRARWGDGHHWHGVLWRAPVFCKENVGTPMVCYPNRDGLPHWMDWNSDGIVSDFGWLQHALGESSLDWHEQIIATVRPETRV